MKNGVFGFFIGVMVMSLLIFSGCESFERGMKTLQSSTTGIERKVVWTGFDGTKKTWTGNFKIDSNEGSNVVYFNHEEKGLVLLGPGWYSEEIN